MVEETNPPPNGSAITNVSNCVSRFSRLRAEFFKRRLALTSMVFYLQGTRDMMLLAIGSGPKTH